MSVKQEGCGTEQRSSSSSICAGRLRRLEYDSRVLRVEKPAGE
jgi:hypothetical protein